MLVWVSNVAKYLQGKYKPKNPSKYRGDVNNIIYRSSWELQMLNHLDRNNNVIEYASEEFFIPYVSPVDNRVHRYFPDFYVKSRMPNGDTQVQIVEVKPYNQTMPPKPNKSGRKTKRLLTEAKTWAVNQAKWKAAEEFCKDNNYKFVIITEKELGIK